MACVLLTIASLTQWLVCRESPVNICWIFYVREKKKGCYVTCHPLHTMKCAILTLHGKIHLISREIPLAFEEGGEAEREGCWLLHFLINFSDDAFWMLNTFEDLNMPTHTEEHICIQLPLKHFLQFGQLSQL